VSVLSAGDLGVSYDGRDVLFDVKVELTAGDLLVVLGPNGAGKTTLLRALAGTIAPTRGTVTFEGRDLASMARDEIARSIAVVPQEIPLADGFSVREVVAMGRAPHQGRWLRSSPEDRTIVEEAIARCEVESFADRPFAELSGGERKRVMVAQALAQRPRVLLLDEPSAFLDLEHAVALFELVTAEVARGTSVLAISHDLALTARFAQRVALLCAGRLSNPGPAAEVLHPDRLREVFHVEVERFLDAEGRPRAFAATKKHVVS